MPTPKTIDVRGWADGPAAARRPAPQGSMTALRRVQPASAPQGRPQEMRRLERGARPGGRCPPVLAAAPPPLGLHRSLPSAAPCCRPLPPLAARHLQDIYDDYKMRRSGLLLALIDGAAARCWALQHVPPVRLPCRCLFCALCWAPLTQLLRP